MLDLDFNIITEKLQTNYFIKNFIKDLSEKLKNFTNQNEVETEKNENIQLTPEEELKFYRQKSKFLQDYFKKELSNLSKGEIYLVTNKYENDIEYHRYKVAQYKDNKEWKYIAFEKDLPENVQLGDVVRKIDGKYIYDKYATQYLSNSINKIKIELENNR